MARRGLRDFSSAQIDEMLRLYRDERWSIMRVARQFGSSGTIVTKCLRAAGLAPRTRRAAKLSWVKHLDAATLRRLYESPMRPGQIASIYGVSRHTIYSLLRQYGIPQRRRCDSELGVLNPLNGLHHSESTKLLIGERRRQAWANPEYVKRMLLAFHASPTKPEVLITAALSRLCLPFAYNGNTGDLTIARRIPDFRSTDGKLVVIEVFGEFFRDISMGFVTDIRRTESATKAHYKEHGYRCVVLWSKAILAHSKAGDLDSWVVAQLATQG